MASLVDGGCCGGPMPVLGEKMILTPFFVFSSKMPSNHETAGHDPSLKTPRDPPQKAAGDSAAVSDRDADDPTPFPRVRACPREFAVQLRARNLRKSRVKYGVIYVGRRLA